MTAPYRRPPQQGATIHLTLQQLIDLTESQAREEKKGLEHLASMDFMEVTCIVAAKLGTTALGQWKVIVDLGNGHSLHVQCLLTRPR